MTNNTLSTFRNISSKLTVNSIANTSKEGNIVPLQTGDGQRVNASVVEIKPDVVVVDLNHPLAGADLIFEGEIIESRPATNEEIQELIKLMSGEGRGCGCDSCGGGCGDNECDDCGCEGGHCHK